MAGWDDLARLRAVAAACGRRVAAALLSRSNGLPPSHDSVAAACAAACAQHFAAAGHPEMATLRHPIRLDCHGPHTVWDTRPLGAERLSATGSVTAPFGLVFRIQAPGHDR